MVALSPSASPDGDADRPNDAPSGNTRAGSPKRSCRVRTVPSVEPANADAGRADAGRADAGRADAGRGRAVPGEQVLMGDDDVGRSWTDVGRQCRADGDRLLPSAGASSAPALKGSWVCPGGSWVRPGGSWVCCGGSRVCPGGSWVRRGGPRASMRQRGQLRGARPPHVCEHVCTHDHSTCPYACQYKCPYTSQSVDAGRDDVGMALQLPLSGAGLLLLLITDCSPQVQWLYSDCTMVVQ